MASVCEMRYPCHERKLQKTIDLGWKETVLCKMEEVGTRLKFISCTMLHKSPLISGKHKYRPDMAS